MSNEQLYYDTLKRIARQYRSSENILRNAEKKWGLPGDEALQAAYDNIQAEADRAIYTKRRPTE